MTDFELHNHGTISVLFAKTEAAKAWVEAHLPEDRQTWGHDGTAIEHRYVGDILVGIQEDGLTVS